MDTYKVGTVADSESTMHTITNFDFTPEMFSHDESFYHNNELTVQTGMTLLQQDIFLLNTLRKHFLAEKDVNRKKMIWRTIIQKLPDSYLQQRTWTGNYSILRSLDHQRDGHRLSEWNVIRKEIKKLPYSKELILLNRTTTKGE